MKALQKFIRALQIFEALIAFHKNAKNPKVESQVFRDLRDANDKTKTLHISLF